MSDYFVVRKGATALPNGTVWDERIRFAALGILARARAEAERSLPAGASPMALARAAAGLMARWLADPAGAAV